MESSHDGSGASPAADIISFQKAMDKMEENQERSERRHKFCTYNENWDFDNLLKTLFCNFNLFFAQLLYSKCGKLHLSNVNKFMILLGLDR